MQADIIPLCFRDACYIAANIRQQDWDECRCQLYEENKFALAQLCFFGTEEGLRWCARLDKQPVAAFGAVKSGPGQYQLWMWSTPKLRRVFPKLVKFLDGPYREIMNGEGARRVEIRSMDGHDFQERGFFERAGAIKVASLPQFGKNGESFTLYAWWKGMPDAKDIRSGYHRVRDTSDSGPVLARMGHRQHSGYVSRDDSLMPKLPLNGRGSVGDAETRGRVSNG